MKPKEISKRLKIMARKIEFSNNPRKSLVIEDLRRIVAEITYKSAPEYASIEDFVDYVYGDEKNEFTHEDLNALNYRLHRPIRDIKKELESYGLKLKLRGFEKKPRGFQSPDHDRWYGPGSIST
jgi:hypothetical protein